MFSNGTRVLGCPTSPILMPSLEWFFFHLTSTDLQTSLQTLGIILEKKVFKKLKLSKNGNNKKHSRKLKVKFRYFWMTCLKTKKSVRDKQKLKNI